MIIPLSPARVRTEASFTAEDPWNQNRRTAFTVEAYLLVIRGTPPPVGAKPLSGYLYGIRSELDGGEHMLPEALSELWRTNRIAAETLPRLLKLMQPKLKAWDYRPILHNKVLNIVQYVVSILFLLISLFPFGIAVFTGEIPINVALGERLWEKAVDMCRVQNLGLDAGGHLYLTAAVSYVSGKWAIFCLND
jgi:hypothetical protein